MLPSLEDLLPEFVFCTAFWDKVCAINAMIHAVESVVPSYARLVAPDTKMHKSIRCAVAK
jgi:hypothetical protein